MFPSKSLAIQWAVSQIPYLVAFLAVQVGLSIEQVKMAMITGATAGVVLVILYVAVRLVVWTITTAGVTSICAIITKNAVLGAVGVLSCWVIWEYFSIENFSAAYFWTYRLLQYYGLVQVPA